MNHIEKKMTDEQKAKLKKGLLIGAAVVGTAAAAYFGYKYVKNTKALSSLMSDANSNIDMGKRMVDKLYKESFDEVVKAEAAGKDYGLDPVTSKSITYLGNDLKNHTASYEVYARNIPDHTTGNANRIVAGRTFENADADTQKKFETLKEFKKARKKAGYSNWVV